MRRGPRGIQHQADSVLLKGLVRSLVKNGAIKTSTARVKQVKSFVDKLMTIAGKNTPASERRLAAELFGDREAVAGLIKARKRSQRTSGFTRDIKFGSRFGDSAPISKLEWVDKEVKIKAVAKKSKDAKEETAQE